MTAVGNDLLMLVTSDLKRQCRGSLGGGNASRDCRAKGRWLEGHIKGSAEVMAFPWQYPRDPKVTVSTPIFAA